MRRLPQEAATDARRLEYLVTLGPSLILSQGPGAQRVEAVYGEAVQLCERVEPSPDHVAAFWGWWRISPGIHAQLERAERLYALAKRLADPGVLLQAHHCLWATRFNLSDFAGSWRHIEAGLKLYDEGDYRGQADFFGGHDARVCGSGEAALVLWHLGSPEQALRYCLDALNWSEQLGHAGSRLHALDIAVTFRRYRREPEAATDLAQRMIDLGRERGLADHLAKGRLYLGWTIAASGEREQGIAMINEAFAIERVSGTPEDFSIYSDMLAEILVAAGRAGTALDEVERAIAEAEERVWPIWLPELHRRRGEVLLALSAPRADEAEACFCRGARPRARPAVACPGAARGHQPRPPLARRRAAGAGSGTPQRRLSRIHRGVRYARPARSPARARRARRVALARTADARQWPRLSPTNRLSRGRIGWSHPRRRWHGCCPTLAASGSRGSPTSPGWTGSACPWSPSAGPMPARWPSRRARASASLPPRSRRSWRRPSCTMPRRFPARCGGRGPTSWAASGHSWIRSSCRARAAAPNYDGPLAWIEARDLRHGGIVLVPFAAVSADYTQPADTLGPGLSLTTSGLGAGNDRDEAVLQGLTELIERDAVTLWRLGGRLHRAESTIDPSTLGRPAHR